MAEPTTPVTAGIEVLGWLSGRWVGTHGADDIEETWSPANGTSMMGMFRAVRDGQPRFYELITMDREGDGLVCRFKHFDRQLVGWEERDEALVLDLVAVTSSEALFLRRGTTRRMTYRHHPTDRLTVFFEEAGEGHDPDEEYRFERH
jgi:hypothetical protein